jgi:hypothetical protein
MTATDLIIRDYIRARRSLVRRNARDPAGAAVAFVVSAHALNADRLPLDMRADLAGTQVGYVSDPRASVLEIWLDTRRWRPRLPIDAFVDQAIAEIQERRRGLH